MKKKISIRLILILGMPGLVMGIISFIILSTYVSSKQVFTEHAREIMGNISSYTIDKSRSHLYPARDAALLTSGLAVNKIVTSSRKTEMEHYFFEQLLVNSQFSNIYYGTVDGEFVMVSRRNDEGFMTKNISISESGRSVQFRETDLFFQEKDRYQDNSDTYDPRKRPWFSQAIEAGSLIWTDPYVFFTSRNPGITTASPVYNENGSLHGVVGVDIEISELSDFLATLSIGKSGKAFILDNKGKVLAYPEKSRLTVNTDDDAVHLATIGELDDEISKAAYEALLSKEYELDEKSELFFTFKHDRQVFHAMFAPFKASYWPWLLGIYIPEDDYIGALKKNRTFSVFISLSVGLITILIGFLITRSIVQPLLRLQGAAKSVGSGNLKSPLNIETAYREVDETARVFELMRIELEEKSRIEEQLQQTQKVESIGRLASGVAHDLNNLLTPILGYSEMLMNKIPEESLNRQIRQIFNAGGKARDLVQQLLAFSRKQELEYKPLDLNKVVTGFQKLLKRTIRENISIEIVESEITPAVMADPGQIEQVILNLCVNGQDAMPSGGVLTIELTVVEMDQRSGRKYSNIEQGFYVLLAISDTGQGMAPEIKDKIFEPFFSTKGEFGIGLGLATVYGIVNQHNGDIQVYSEPGRGSTFNIYLPLCSESLPGEEREMEGESRRGSETVLVAEDNSQVKELTEMILRDLGYHVLSGNNGTEALNLLAGFQGKVDLLLTDVIMPDMNGRELFEKAASQRADLKVLYMSGYADNAIVQHNILESGSLFIQKPFSMGSLAKKLREVLEID
ncbi:MAG: response regulator [Spirochaetales bacterium]|nr:response regulator [Spirochaetales bacterium]